MQIYQLKNFAHKLYTQPLFYTCKIVCSNTLLLELWAHTSYFGRIVPYKKNFPGLLIPNLPLSDQRISLVNLHFTPQTNSSCAEISNWLLIPTGKVSTHSIFNNILVFKMFPARKDQHTFYQHLYSWPFPAAK